MTTERSLLLIDDDEDFAALLALALKRAGFIVTVVHSTEAAVALATEQQFAYATVDLKMGGESGLVAVQKLAQLCPNIRMVVLTGYAGIKTAIEAIKLGAIHYLAKPATIDEILEAFDADTADVETPVAERVNTVGVLEWERIQQALAQNDFNISATARALGMHRRTLQRKLQKRQLKE